MSCCNTPPNNECVKMYLLQDLGYAGTQVIEKPILAFNNVENTCASKQA